MVCDAWQQVSTHISGIMSHKPVFPCLQEVIKILAIAQEDIIGRCEVSTDVAGGMPIENFALHFLTKNAMPFLAYFMVRRLHSLIVN